MNIQAQVDFSSVYDMLEDLQKVNMWNYVAQRLKAFVKELMVKGIDINGKKYRPYVTSYKKKRAKEGLQIQVNLQYTSAMFLGITARATNDGFEVFINGSLNNKKAEWVSKTRKFLEWGKATEKELQKTIDEYFKLKGYNA